MKQKLTQEYLKECLTYDPGTGIFTWKERPIHHFKDGKKLKAYTICKRWNTRYSNKICNTFNTLGYGQVYINSIHYYLHRLAFLYMEGYMPEHDVDHIDRNPSNNKWDNLRHVTHKCNMQNKKIQSNNKSGVVGVCYIKHNNKWFAQLQINKTGISLGYYKNFDDAVMARYNEEQSNINWNCLIESSAEGYLKGKNIVKR